jgi:nucleoside-diphosphate-sugar epimerase
MQVLVTGASGFVGSALCRELVRRGHSVRGLTRSPERAAQRVGEQVTLLAGSVGHPREVAEAARACEVVFHAAGIAALHAPLRVLRWVHVAGTENVLRAARHAGVKRVVHVSCADVSLHAEDRMHWDERRVLPYKPVGAHAQTKLMAEELALAHSDENLAVTALRPAYLWGEDDVDGVARLAREARDGGVLLYAGGRNIVATTHVDNLVKAALAAATAPDAPARTYYVTDGEFLEAREFYGKLCSALGLPAPRTTGNLQLALARAKVRELLGRDHGALRAHVLGRAKSALFDVSRAIQDLQYEPRVDLEAAMDSLGRWARAQGGVEAIMARARAEPLLADVDEQVRAAGGD